MHFPTDRTAHTTAFYGPVVDHWLEQKIAQTANVCAVPDRSDDPNLYRWVLYRLNYYGPLLSLTRLKTKMTKINFSGSYVGSNRG